MSAEDAFRGPGAPARPLGAALQLAARLRQAGLRFAHWKSNGHLAEALAGLTDIDMLADPAQRGRLRGELAAFGAVEVVSQPWSRYPDVEDWLIVDEATGRFLHIHLHFAMMTGLRRVKHLRIPWAEQLLATAVDDAASGWPLPAPAMEWMTLLVRSWAKMPPLRRLVSPRLPRHIREEFIWLSARTSPRDVAELSAILLPRLDPAPLVALAAKPEPSDAEIIAAARLAYAELRGSYRMAWGPALAAAAVLNVRAWAAKKRRKLMPAVVTGKTVAGKGQVIAFIGSDGSGKSTVTEIISRWLKYKLDVHRYYMGSGDGGSRLQDRVRRFAKAKTRKPKPAGAMPEKTLESFAAPRRVGFIHKVAALHHLSLVRGKVKMLRKAHALAEGGSIVVLDRFPQSQFAGLYDGPRLQNGRGFAWAARAEMRALAAAQELMPHLVIKLLVTPEVAHRRKPDHNLSVMKLKCDITRALVFPGAKVAGIDAGRPLDEVVLAAKAAVWSAIRSGAEGDLHGTGRA